MTTKITLERRNQASHFVAHNNDGNTVSLDGAPAVGGEGRGFRPMELALSALAGCASMDVGPILTKQRQTLRDLRVTATGERADGTPAPYTSINLHFDLAGDISETTAGRALDLAVHKYCSVGAMLRDDIKVTWTMTIHRDRSGWDEEDLRSGQRSQQFTEQHTAQLSGGSA